MSAREGQLQTEYGPRRKDGAAARYGWRGYRCPSSLRGGIVTGGGIKLPQKNLQQNCAYGV